MSLRWFSLHRYGRVTPLLSGNTQGLSRNASDVMLHVISCLRYSLTKLKWYYRRNIAVFLACRKLDNRSPFRVRILYLLASYYLASRGTPLNPLTYTEENSAPSLFELRNIGNSRGLLALIFVEDQVVLCAPPSFHSSHGSWASP